MAKNLFKKSIALLAGLALTVSLTGCSSDKETPKVGADSSVLEYIQELEANGNTEAAEAVSRNLLRARSGELIRDAHKNTPIIRANDELEQLKSITKHIKKENEK